MIRRGELTADTSAYWCRIPIAEIVRLRGGKPVQLIEWLIALRRRAKRTTKGTK